MTMLLPRRIESSSQLSNASTPNRSASGANRGNVTTSLFMGWAQGQSAYAQNSTEDYYVAVENGTYTLTVLHALSSDFGIVTAQLDGVDLGSKDFYNTSQGTFNQVWTISNIVVTSTGVKTLRFTPKTKNASSSNYGVGVCYWSLQRTDKGAELGRLAYAPKHIDICPWVSCDSISGATLNREQESTRLGGGNFVTSGPTSTNSVSWYVALAAGTYSLAATWLRFTSCGIFDVTLGSTTVMSSWDQYGSLAANQTTTWAGISVASDGIHELKFTCVGKNPSSSNYQNRLHWLTLQWMP